MIGSARVYAQANQGVLVTPFMLAGAMAPVTTAAACAQTLAEAMAGMTFVQLVRPGCPMVFGSFASSPVDAVGRADIRHAGAGAAPLRRRPAGAPARRAVPSRRQPVRLQGRPTRRPPTNRPTRSSRRSSPGINFVLHAAGWLEGGLTIGYEKFVMDADQCGMAATFVKGIGLTENDQAIDAILSNGPGQHFLGHPHTLANFETAFYRSEIADNNSYEQWLEAGSLDAAQRANPIWKRTLAEYEAPPIDPGDRRGAASTSSTQRKASFPDSNV